MASRIVGLVQSVSLKLKIESCTHGDDEPAPIYRMDEVLETVGRDSKNIDDAVDCIEQRLQYRSSNVKQKTLKLIKYIAQKGSSEFQRGLNRLAPVIRELTHYTCPPDPFKGDIPWKRVQQYAKEALDVIHHGSRGDGGGMGMVGFGSDQHASGMTPLSAPTSNTAFGTTFSVGLRDIRDSAMEALGSNRNQMGVKSMRSERSTISHAAGATTSPPSSSRYTQEAKAVDRFCCRSSSSSSVRIAPTVEECSTFASSVAGRDGTALAKAIEKNIQHGTWQESLRALCVLDVISKPGRQVTSTDEAMMAYFKSHPKALEQAATSAQERVRSKSTSVLSHLGCMGHTEQEKPDVDDGLLLLSLDQTPEEPQKCENPCVVDHMSNLLLSDEKVVPNSPVAGLVSPSTSNTSTQQGTQSASDPFGDWTSSSPLLFGEHIVSPPIQQQQATMADPFLSLDTAPQVTTAGDKVMMLGATPLTTQQPDASSTWHAATSGFSSSRREDAAFDFVKSAMADVTRKKP